MRFTVLAIVVVGLAVLAEAAPQEVPLPPQKPTVTIESVPEEEPDVWSEAEIRKAESWCKKQLHGRTITYKPAEPLKSGACGTPFAVTVSAIGKGADRVQIKPAALLNCNMVAKLDDWLKTVVQPAAKKHLKQPLESLKVVASYSCRRRYNDKKKRMSEHAFANALDIASFTTTKGDVVNFLKHWGLTKREKQKRLDALAKAQMDEKVGAKKNKKSEPVVQMQTTNKNKPNPKDASVKHNNTNKTAVAETKTPVKKISLLGLIVFHLQATRRKKRPASDGRQTS